MTAHLKEYVSGGVADYLASFCKRADNAGTSDENRKLSALFSVDIKRKSFEDADDDRKSAKKAGTIVRDKTNKRKHDEIEDILASTGETREDEHTPKRSRPAYDPEKLGRTVFIGNLPISITKKKVMRLFKSHGHSDIASVRLRSAVSADPKMSKRGAVIKREFHPDQKTINAYAVFTNLAAATKALDMNATELDGYHIRVDLAGNSRKHDVKTSLFVGNLPFDAEDEALRAHFSVCGHVTAVRIVRDPRTRIGKGFGFVTFDSSDSISLALQMKSSKFSGRELRLQRCENQPTKTPVLKAAKPLPTPKRQEREKEQSRSTKANSDGKAKTKPDGKKRSHNKFRPPTNKRHGTPSVQSIGKRSKKTNKAKGKKDRLPKNKKSKKVES